MERVKFVTYKGKKILIEDFSKLKAGPELLDAIKTAQAAIASQPPKSVLAVLDAHEVGFNSTVLEAMKEFTNANKPYVKAACVVGITGLLQVALTAVSKFSGREFPVFKTREEAMDWLVTR